MKRVPKAQWIGGVGDGRLQRCWAGFVVLALMRLIKRFPGQNSFSTDGLTSEGGGATDFFFSMGGGQFHNQSVSGLRLRAGG